MASEMMVSISIGAALQGSFAAAFGGAKKAFSTLGQEIESLNQKHVKLGDSIQKHMGNLSDKTIGSMTRQYDAMGAAIDRATHRQLRLGDAIAAQRRAGERRQELRGEMRETIGTAAAILTPVGLSVRAYMEQEKAMTDMKIAYMKSGGEVGEAFNEVKRQAVELGNQFPGTTADFLKLGRVLKEQGVADSAVTGGGLRAAASLNVLLDTPQEFGGEFIAKMMEARGIADKDIGTAADQVQRAKFAFGMKPGDMLDAMKYDAPTANILGLKGLGNAEKLLAIQGMGAQVGQEGAQFGTNFSTLLTRMAKGPDAIENATKGSKSRSKGYMQEAGVSFDFFDKSGQFGGVENMVTQLEKLKTIKEKLGAEKALTVANDMFGMEGGRTAMIIAEKGSQGLKDNLQKMREQASLQERMAEKSKTLSNAWESMTGTITNGMASVGEIFAGDLQNFFTSANAFISDTLVPWVQNNKELIGGVVKLVGGLLLGKIALLGLSYGANLLLGPLRTANTAFRLLSAGASTLKLIRLGELSKGAGVLRMFGMGAENAAKWSGRLGKVGGAIASAPQKAKGILPKVGGMMGKLNPIGMIGRIAPMLSGAFAPILALGAPVLLIIGAIGVAGLLIYKYWKPIKAFFQGLWQGLKAGLQPLQPLFSAIGAAAAKMFLPVKPVWDWVVAKAGAIVGWFKNILHQEEDVGGEAKSMGVKVGAAIAGFINGAVKLGTTVITKFGEVVSWFKSLPAAFVGFGRNIMQGLLDGVSSMFGAVVDKIKSVGSAIKSGFTGLLGIHSPSRVFKGFGGNIMDGLGIGIDNQAGNVISRMRSVGAGLQQAFAPKLQAPNVPNASLGAALPQGGRSSQSAQGMVITYSPQITVQSGGADAQGQVKKALDMSLIEFERMLDRVMTSKNRRGYA